MATALPGVGVVAPSKPPENDGKLVVVDVVQHVQQDEDMAVLDYRDRVSAPFYPTIDLT